MEEESINTIYCRKVRCYPSSEHKLLFEKCFGATRYLTNLALENIKNGNITQTTNAIAIRNYLKYQNKYLNDDNMWLKDVPFDTRENAIRQLCSNFKTAFTQLRTGQIKKFYMHFKRKNSDKQVCFINKKAFNIKKKTLFYNKIKHKIKFDETIISHYKDFKMTDFN